MEKDKKEETIIRDLLEKIAISHPEIRFQLSSNGRIVLDTPGTGMVMDVVKGLYGADMADNLIALNYENKPMKLAGFVGNLKTMRNHRDDQVFFINGRYVKNNRLAQALDEAYEGYSMKHQHPLGIIFLELPGRMLDVNIHPAKTEIKILNESLVCLLFKQGIRETLRNTNLIVELGTVDNCDRDDRELNNQNSQVKASESSYQQFQTEDQTTIETMLQQTAFSKNDPNLGKPLNPNPLTDCFDHEQVISKTKALIKKQNIDLRPAAAVLVESVVKLKETPIAEIRKEEQEGSPAKAEAMLMPDLFNRVNEAPQIFELDQENSPKSIPETSFLSVFKKDVKDLAKMKIVGQLFNVYILLEGEKEIYLLDQHAAHEAFLTQELMEIFDRKEGLPSQGLMTPVPLKVRPKDLTLIENVLDEYRKLGYDCDIFGDDTLLVRSVPVLLGEPQSPDLLKAMIEENFFESDGNINVNTVFSEKAKNKIITMACKAAIKGGQSLTHDEIRKLLENLMNLSNPYTCPHGRPIIMRLKEYELMKLFKRVI